MHLEISTVTLSHIKDTLNAILRPRMVVFQILDDVRTDVVHINPAEVAAFCQHGSRANNGTEITLKSGVVFMVKETLDDVRRML